MSGVNKVILIGHLGKDPEIRGTSSGGVVASFSLATSETWKDKTTGERKEATEWHSVVVFNEVLVKLAENHLRKGAKIYVEGALKTRKWTDKDGKDRWTTEIVLQNFRGEIQMLDRIEGNRPPPAESTEDYGKVSGRSDGMAAASAIVRGDPAGINDEIPF